MQELVLVKKTVRAGTGNDSLNKKNGFFNTASFFNKHEMRMGMNPDLMVFFQEIICLKK